MNVKKSSYSSWLGVLAGLIYGVLVQFVFHFPVKNDFFQSSFAIVTFGYIFLVPLVLGMITISFSAQEENLSWGYRIFTPWLPSLGLLAIALVVGWEGSICLIMAAPAVLIMASLGGVVASLLGRSSKRTQSSAFVILGLAFLPFVSSAFENRFTRPHSLRTVKTQIVIHADRATVWQNIIRVPEIKAHEHRFSFFHAIGFPRPVEATLSHPGVGGIRHATFEGGVLFVETIDTWNEMAQLSFKIKADTKNIPATTLDQHVTIGGEYFDTLEGRYEIEPLGEREVILHLRSVHRLSTHFNFYSGLWTDAIMADIQNSILQIIKARCEATNSVH